MCYEMSVTQKERNANNIENFVPDIIMPILNDNKFRYFVFRRFVESVPGER